MEKRKYLIGEKYVNGKGLEFEIIGYCGKSSYRKIKFIKSGYIDEVDWRSVVKGEVKDRLSPSVHGVGINDLKRTDGTVLYQRWYDMIDRCYNPSNGRYKTYGGNGVTVCKEWLYFSKYLKDMKSKENYDELIASPSKWQIDKDIKSNGNRFYSNENVSIVRIEDNLREQYERCGNGSVPVEMFDTNGVKLREFKSMAEATRETKINNISYCCNGKRRMAGGYIWRFKNNEENIND